MPVPGKLAQKLREKLEIAEKAGHSEFGLVYSDAALFASAAVEIWLRAVHSFLISNSLTKASPIWSSVTGYYASHYVMRAFSHLLGYFLLGRQSRAVHMTLVPGGFHCDALKKKKPPTEHQYYWEIPKKELGVATNLLFSDNAPIKNEKNDRDKVTDGFHRIYANYFDHVSYFREFEPLNEDFLKARINRLSELVTDSPTIPDHNKFPDLDSVQIIAYARIVLFRNFVDEIVGPKNTYWKYYRTPAWFQKYMTFQLPQGSTLSTLSNIV